MTRFLLELGAGFAFVGRQHRLTVGDEDFYIDLLFYHLKLRCYVVVELKATPFRPEYALHGMDKAMGIADYQLVRAIPGNLTASLPSIEQIEMALQAAADVENQTVDRNDGPVSPV